MKIRYVLLVLIACLGSFLFGRFIKSGCYVPVADTIVLVDTVRDSIPYPVYETVIQTVPEMFPVYVTLEGDTIREPVVVPIGITHKEYKTDDYRLSVSGYKPSLDYIEVYRRTEQVTKRVQPRRFGLGIIGGYGVGKHGLSPYVGVGGYYSLW